MRHLFCVWLVFLPWTLLFLVLLSSWCFSTYLIAHFGYLHWCRTSCRCCNSSLSSLELEHTALALCVRMLLTLYLQARLWWLFCWRYKSARHGRDVFLCVFEGGDLKVQLSWSLKGVNKRWHFNCRLRSRRCEVLIVLCVERSSKEGVPLW